MERPRDEGLQGNERIEEAIALLQQHPTQELLAHALTVIRRRMQAGGQLVVAVEPDLAGGMRLGTLTIPEGGVWWYAFTSFEEEMKGAASVQSTFLAEMDRLFDQALTVPEIRGIILNPWNRTIQLDKTLLGILKPGAGAAGQ